MYNGYKIIKCTEDKIEFINAQLGFNAGDPNVRRFLKDNDPSHTYIVYKDDKYAGDFSIEETKKDTHIEMSMFLDFETDAEGVKITKAIIEFMRKNFSFVKCDIVLYDGGPFGKNSRMMTIFNETTDMYVSFHHGLDYWVYSFDKVKKEKNIKKDKINELEKKIDDLKKELEQIKKEG